MNNPTFRRQGDPVTVGWTVRRAPLALRGIRFAEGEEGAAPPVPIQVFMPSESRFRV